MRKGTARPGEWRERHADDMYRARFYGFDRSIGNCSRKKARGGLEERNVSLRCITQGQESIKYVHSARRTTLGTPGSGI